MQNMRSPPTLRKTNMRIAMQHWKQDLIASDRRHALPLVLLPGVAQQGKSVRDAIYDPAVQAEAALFLADRYPLPAAVMMMDLSLEAEAFGAQIRIPEHDVPFVTGPCVNDLPSIENLTVPTLDAFRLPTYLRAAELVIDQLHHKPVFASCIGPVSLAARLIEITELMTCMMIEPEKIELLLEKCTTFLLAYASAYKQRGANGILIAEPVAGLLSPDLCEQFSSRYVARIIDTLQDDSFLVILHNCGPTIPLLSSIEGTGAAGLSLGNACDIAEALPLLRPDTLVLGNIDPVSVLQRGTCEDVIRIVQDRLRLTAPHRNYLISSGCDIPYATPLSNLDAMFRTLDEHHHS
jgi:uroporphyrinogen decarboxylase